MSSFRLLFTMLVVACATSAWSADGDIIKAQTIEGVEMTFHVICESDKSCGVSANCINSNVSGAITIPQEVNGYTVVEITQDAFFSRPAITSVSIPNTVKVIGDYAFAYCGKLYAVEMPDSLMSIGFDAFVNCSSLAHIKIPNGITQINSLVFGGCENLSQIELPEGLLMISIGGFSGCKKLKNIVIPSSVTFLGNSAFEDCTDLQSVLLQDSIASMGDKVFKNCVSLVTINIPHKVTSIGVEAFAGCEKLELVDLPDSLQTINSYAFSGCTSLREISLPTKTTEISSDVFRNCSSLKTITFNQQVVGSWLKNNKVIETVILGDSVEEIADNAFSGCTALQEVFLTKNVKKIGNNPFANCAELKNIGTLNTPIVGTWFSRKSMLENVTFGEAVTEIGASAFSRCTSLQSISLPASISSIGSLAFYDCNNLTQVRSFITKPFAVTTNAFPWKKAILIVPVGTKSDYKSVTGWKDAVIFEEGETTYAKTRTDEQGICYTLNQTADDYFYSVTGHTDNLLEEITIPNSIGGCKVTSIATNAFTDCTNLKKVTFSDGLSSINFNAFSGCIYITEFVSLINNPSSAGVSDEISNRAHVIVPVGTKGAYLKVSGWNQFFIFEEGEEIVKPDRTITDSQGLIFKIGQSSTSFYYTITGHNDNLSERIVIPETLNGLPVTEVSNCDLFNNCKSLRHVYIPKTFKTPDTGWAKVIRWL